MAIGDHSVHRDQRFGCLLISSPQGHSGKTTVTIGLCDILRRKGLSIQPFKKGPDYIDPSWLTLATGRNCRNLDLFLIPEDRLLISFQQACQGADVAVIEGAMGLYDGFDSTGRGTTAELARLLKSPVILVVNAARMTGSIAAMVTGYQHFQKDVHISGVILNYVSGPRHEGKLRAAVEQYCQIPVVGSIPRDPNLRIAERHLGLIPSPESTEAEEIVERLGRALEPHLDPDKILAIAQSTEAPHPRPLPLGERARVRGDTPRPRIGVIRDRAFNFYYPENLEALMENGAELVFTDSFHDRLPEIDGLYIGGGFPEFFLKELEENRGLRQDIAEAIENDLPVYAECAGLMYLCRKIHWQGRSYEMVGVIPAEVQMLERPQGHGYVVAEVMGENPFFSVGMALRGHEFHHSKLSLSATVKFAYQLRRGQGIQGGEDGIVYKNLFASYTHMHALGSPEWAAAFVSLASKREKVSAHLLHGKHESLLPVNGN
jgi:cobyrinic acid a,c-diamide synthase